MLDSARDLVRTNAFLVLTERQRWLALQVVSGHGDSSLVRELAEILAGLESLARAPAGELVDREMIDGSVAEATETLARAHGAMGNDRRALELFALARERFDALDRHFDGERVGAAIADLRLDVDGGLASELARLHRCLRGAAPNSRRRAQLLVQMGEIRIRGGDEPGACEALDEAETILSRDEHRPPDATMLLAALDESLEALASAEAPTLEASAIDRAMALRELHRRLYAALARAYRATDLPQAERYARLAAALAQPLDVAATSDAAAEPRP